MAILQTNRKVKIQVEVNTGTNTSPKYKKLPIGTWIFAPDATDQKIYNVGRKFANCQNNTYNATIRTEQYQLINQE